MRPLTRPRFVAPVRAHASSAGSAPPRTAPAHAGRPHRAARGAVRLHLDLVLVLLHVVLLHVGPALLAPLVLSGIRARGSRWPADADPAAEADHAPSRGAVLDTPSSAP